MIRVFFLSMLSVVSLFSTGAVKAAGVVKGTVYLNGKVKAPVRATCTVTSSLPLSVTGANSAIAEAKIPTIEYSNVASSTKLATQLGMQVGDVRTSSAQDIEQKLSALQGSNQQGWTKFRMQINCPDTKAMQAITYRIENAQGVTPGVSHLAFDGVTSTEAKNALKLQTLLFFPQLSSNNLQWKNYAVSTAQAIPLVTTEYAIDSYHIITRSTDALQTLSKGDISYTATESFVFNYV